MDSGHNFDVYFSWFWCVKNRTLDLAFAPEVLSHWTLPGLICIIILIANKVGHFLICLLTIYISSFENCLLIPLASLCFFISFCLFLWCLSQSFSYKTHTQMYDRFKWKNWNSKTTRKENTGLLPGIALGKLLFVWLPQTQLTRVKNWQVGKLASLWTASEIIKKQPTDSENMFKWQIYG